MKQLWWIVVVLGALVNSAAVAQTPDPTVVLEDALLSSPDAVRPMIEPHVSADWADPDRLLVVGTSRTTGDDRDDKHCFTYASRDGGETWTRGRLDARGCLDAWTAFLTDGSAVAVVLGDRGTLLYRSPDGGISWEPPVLLGPSDHPTLAVDTAANRLVAVANVRFASGDVVEGGMSFWRFLPDLTVIHRSQLSPTSLHEDSYTPVAFPDGNVLLGYGDFQRRSPEGGFQGRLQGRRWLIEGFDGGSRFSNPRFISETCQSRAGWLSLAAHDGVGTLPETVFMPCPLPGLEQLAVVRSTDRGRSWHDPVLVSGESEWIRTPNIAVNRDGVVAVAWVDRSSDADRVCGHVMIALSSDGGESFSAPFRVSTAPSCPERGRNGQRTTDRWPTGGDYFGLAPVADGSFHVVWPDSRDGVFRLRHARVRP